MSEYSIDGGIGAIRLTVRGSSRVENKACRKTSKSTPHLIPLSFKGVEIIKKRGFAPLKHLFSYTHPEKYLYLT